jgi:Skp family chaperone for outer membrane proteins
VLLSPTQRAAKRKDLEGQQQKLEQRTQELQQRAATRERELLDPIQSKVNSVIEGMRASGNYAIIFDVSSPNSGIVTADKSLDLTQKVIQQLKTGT